MTCGYNVGKVNLKFERRLARVGPCGAAQLACYSEALSCREPLEEGNNFRQRK